LPFPVVPDADGELFRQLTTGWVPCSMLVGPDGKVLSQGPLKDRSGAQSHPKPPASSFWEVVSEGSWPHTICAGDSRRNTASS
jgi:hypothetical protein